MRKLLIIVIQTYRYTFSLLMANHCRFYPSCSVYAVEAVDKHGAIKGSWLMVKRLLRCHPFHPGGVDFVPELRDGPAIRQVSTQSSHSSHHTGFDHRHTE